MSGQIIPLDSLSRADTARTQRKSVRIKDQLVRDLDPPAKGNRIVYDDKISGFGVRITAAGKRSFILNYYFKGRERRITIGAYPEWTVLAARKRAEEYRLKIANGIDPLEEKQSAYAAPTMRELFKRYDEEYLPRLAPRTAADIRSMFAKIILPRLGAKKVSDVTFTDCEALHRFVSQDRPVRANRVHEVLRRSFNLAIRWGWVADNPAARVERNTEHKRARYLTQDEIGRLLDALDAHPQRTSCAAIKFMLLTGCRRGEALGARWDQFDPALRVWVKPAATTKQRREHRVPLSSIASGVLQERQAMLDALPQDNPLRLSGFVFAGDEGRALVDVKRTWAAVSKAAGLGATRMHDLRHTFASIAVSQGQSLPVIGAMLGHTQPQTTARYAHLFDDSLLNAAEMVGASISKRPS
ncbi:Prophage integrase IntS [Roseibaca ekhonensis]|uniref:Prophage integrase IntS n=1 Tax=Roseinatronobacter ekhonensis TaxID=254356 RepID=A0A3B0MAK2_9RHOB|nr:site-specific integrase [Roseibaca ekhonensis]SUZ32955.1 Prophage integrase IntS [Roseibaca ekhonensis]